MARTLQDELKQTRPFELLEEEVYLSVIRTAAALERQFAQVLKPFGLTHTQYNVLRILRGAGDEGLCRNEVGARLLREVPDVTRLLDRMKQMRLIRRQRADTDRRLVRTHITPKGLDGAGGAGRARPEGPSGSSGPRQPADDSARWSRC